MRPIQWHLKNNWRVPESLEKMILIPRSLHPYLQWWLEEGNVLTGQPLHPIKHALQIFTDASKEGWGAHLNERTARGSWSLPESKLHINFLELKAVFIALIHGQTSKLLGNLAGSGCRSESSSNPERGLHPPLLDPAKTHKVSYSHKLLCQSPQEQLPVGGITSAYRQKCSGISKKQNLSELFQPTIFSSQAQPKTETYTRPEQSEFFPQGGEIQDGDTGNHQDIPPTRGVGHLDRLQGRLLPYTNTGTIQEISEISPPGADIAIQSTAFRSVHSTLGVPCGSKRGKTGGYTQEYLDDWLVRARSHQACLQHTQELVKLCQELGWLVNLEKSELEHKQIFDCVGYQFDLRAGRVRPTPDRWQNLQDKVSEILSLPACPVRQLMSLIGLLTATEKQVHLGRLHMRPIQWHLRNNWRVPESLEKVIQIPRSLHPHLQWWLLEENVLIGQPLHPIKHTLQIFTDASKEGWGTHLNERTARGSWSLPESKLHINYLELKAVFLALKEFQDLCAHRMILVATDNTTVVSYKNKEGGMRSGPLYALLWRILTWCTSHRVTLRARHIPGRLNVVADNLSRLGHTIQTEWSLLQEVFQAICSRWHRPNIDLFATRFNNKLAQFVSPVPDPLATAVDALSLPWEDLDAYAFPPAAILGKVVEKLQDSPCKRIILIAPGWPNMPWFWDLVAMSSQIPLSLPSLPNLLTQPFNQIPHRNLTNLNLHAWLLEPQQSRSRDSLRQWQRELRFLEGDQPDQSMRQSGPFLQSGASLIRWTSGHPL